MLFGVNFPVQLEEKHTTIFVRFRKAWFVLNGLIIMLDSLSVILRSLFAQRIGEIVVGLREAAILRKRLLEVDLGFGELLGMHELDALVVDLYWLIALLLFERAASRSASCTER